MEAIWTKADIPKDKNGYKVFSTFACGGGSSFGYKLAGYDVIGANDIDPEMAEIYKINHNPKHYYLMDIRELSQKAKDGEVAPELFDLDILDGSPPCSSFSMAGSRDKKWGEKKKFREGQAEQTLDDLFFRFIELAETLQPKVVIAENVRGMIQGKAKSYVLAVRDAFDKAGYDAQLFLLNSATMGVPQKRERVFFIARRKDLKLPKIALDFNEPIVTFGDIRTDEGLFKEFNKETKMYSLWNLRKKTDTSFKNIVMRLNPGSTSYFSENILHDDTVPQTIVSGSGYYLYDKPQTVTSNDLISIQTFPQDYNFIKESYLHIKYVLGMSVPPFMTKGVAEQVKEQLLDILKGRPTKEEVILS